MADEATGRDLEPLAGSTSAGSVHGSQHCDCADLASHSAANRTRSYDRAKEISLPGPNFAPRVPRGCCIDRTARYSGACLSASSWSLADSIGNGFWKGREVRERAWLFLA